MKGRVDSLEPLRQPCADTWQFIENLFYKLRISARIQAPKQGKSN
jgi:hypothetical protein